MADSPAEHDPEATTLGEHAAAMADPGSARSALDRGRFLSGVTVGLGGLMSAVIAAPALGFVLAPAFETEPHYDVDLGPTSLYPVDKSNPFHVVTFTRSPKRGGRPRSPRRLHPQRRRRQVHGDREHLHAPRLPGARLRLVRLRLPVPRRPVRRRGAPHRRPAGAPAEPLRHQGRERPPVPRPLYAMDDSLHKHKLKAPGQPVTGLLSFLYPPAPQ